MDDPPAEAYGRVTNPERFAALIPAAQKLITDLGRRFDVTVTRVPVPASTSRTVELVTSTRITPVRADQAPLTITVTTFPGLYLDAGAGQHIALPNCGCDACGEDAENALRELAEYADALTAGGLCERITSGRRPVLEGSWKGDGWGRSGRSALSTSQAADLRRMTVAPPPSGQWQPWSVRS